MKSPLTTIMHKGPLFRLNFYFITVSMCLMAMYVLFTLNLTRCFSMWMGVICVVESAAVVAPVYLLPGRWKSLTLAPVWLMAIFFFANIVFARFSRDMIPFSLAFHPASYNTEMLRCIPALLRLHDLPYLLLPLLATYTYRTLGVSSIAWSPRIHRAMALVPVLILAAYFFTMAYICTKWAKVDGNFLERARNGLAIKTDEKKDGHRPGCSTELWYDCGMAVYLLGQRQLLLQGQRIALTNAERRRIDDFLAAGSTAPDSTFAANSGKNLIFIVVESLNAWPVGKRYGDHAVTPVIDSLINLPGTISCLDVVPQIVHGESSDGQFMYNTGLLPLRNTAVALYFPLNTYIPHTLAAEMGCRRAEEFIVENSRLWNHYITTFQYGYSRLNSGIHASGNRSADEHILEVAADSIAGIEQPFYAFITTISSHYPFTEKQVPHPQWICSQPLDKLDINYLCTINNIDRQIGVFIERLHSRGLYDNSVIVIASDHHTEVPDASVTTAQPGYEPIVFLAINTGRHEKIDRTVGQIDVYPTILEIMNRSHGGSLGISMLDRTNRSAVDGRGQLFGTSGDSIDARKREAWDISGLMIRGDYFGSTTD